MYLTKECFKETTGIYNLEGSTYMIVLEAYKMGSSHESDLAMIQDKIRVSKLYGLIALSGLVLDNECLR